MLPPLNKILPEIAEKQELENSEKHANYLRETAENTAKFRLEADREITAHKLAEESIEYSTELPANAILQYQQCNGFWKNCGNRTDEFLEMCTKSDARAFNRGYTIALLLQNLELRNDKNDWYSVCRLKPATKTTAPKFEKKLDCGHSITDPSHEMSASVGSACAECYDEMSL